MGDVNPDFIQPTEFRPNPTSTIEAKGIPVIDISSANDEVIAEIKEACEKWGFFSKHTKNVRDWKEIFDYTVLDPTLIPASHEIGDEEIRELRNQWPDYPPDF
uniref:Non-haem dioxygenase N-terminal domain-containing protein n=1 Tax=Chenopodium quinoa TaxID=63459 RepID=A0A803LNW2_CHEQI